jgi:hypothetical protein
VRVGRNAKSCLLAVQEGGQSVSFESLVVARVGEEDQPAPDAVAVAQKCPKYTCLRLRGRDGRELGQAVSASSSLCFPPPP